MEKAWLALVTAVAVVSAAGLAHARPDAFPYSIMVPEKGAKPDKPEPWLAPKYKSPRGTREHVTMPRPTPPASPRRATVPPPIPVPETGRVLPNLPAAPNAGAVESGQDRALRCAHQAGVYGQAAGDRGTYIRTCINQ